MKEWMQITLMNNKNRFSVIYKSILSIIVLIAVMDRAGIFSVDKQLQTLYSFTTISNCYIVAVALITAFKILTSKNINPALLRLRHIGVMMILITGLIYHLILLPQKITENPNYQIFTYGNIVAHYIAPIITFLDWLLFDKKGSISKWEPLICTSIPMVYFLLASIYGYYGSTIPNKETSYVYFFMDWGELGFTGVMKWVFAILGCILFLTYLVYLIDYLLAKKGHIVHW